MHVTRVSPSSPVLVIQKAAEMGNGGGTGRNQPPVGAHCCAYRPEWVEPVAQHLIKRTYSEPHWNGRRAR
ncbi:hypothetical protein ACULNC_12205 [Shigella flexneri]